MSLALDIVAAICACYLIYIFGSGVLTVIGAEYEWSRGRRIRGGKAVLMGFGMMLCAPLAVALAVGSTKIGLFSTHVGICIGTMVTAVLYWLAMQALTKKFDIEEG
jgi:hypothetical protein